MRITQRLHDVHATIKPGDVVPVRLRGQHLDATVQDVTRDGDTSVIEYVPTPELVAVAFAPRPGVRTTRTVTGRVAPSSRT